MLDGLLGRGYSSKCKSLMKLTKSRIELIRRKRNATLKFLKEVMADLLAKGHEMEAYGRAEGLLAEVIMSSCYDYVDKSCDFVLRHLSSMQKIRHCPEDCKEAVSSLMFAAARFSDLPELRDLRDIFLERYGSSLELFANKQFVEHLSSAPITTDKKVRLMREIASEFNIAWDSKGFEQRASRPSLNVQEQPKVHRSSSENEYRSNKGKDTVLRGNIDVSPKERPDIANNGHKLQNEKERKNSMRRNELDSQTRYDFQNIRYNAYNPPNAREEPSMKSRDTHDSSSKGKQKAPAVMRDPWKMETPEIKGSSASSSQNKITVTIREMPDPLSHQKPDTHYSRARSWANSDAGQYNVINSAKDVQEEDKKSSFYHNNPIPPPYTKPNSKPKDVKYEGSVRSRSPLTDSDGRSEKKFQEAYYAEHERPNGQTLAPNDSVNQEIGISNPIPKPRSSRRRHSKSGSSHYEVDILEDSTGVSKRSSRSRRRDESKRGLQILFDDEHHEKDEEERMIDRLLMHYSKKPSACEPETVRRKPRSHHRIAGLEDKEPGNIRKGGPEPDEIPDIVQPPRSVSLPREQTGQPEAPKVFNRAATFQPDRSSAAKHVHPKLPDYDDLAARFAALKGR